MKPILPILVFWTTLTPARAQQGLELTLSKPYAHTATAPLIFSLSWYTRAWLSIPGYQEYGVTAMPPMGASASVNSSESKAADFVGVYTGHLFLPFHGLVRPGFELGWLWEGLAESGAQLSRHQFAFYYAMKVQVSCLTVLVSNQGIGGGVNLHL